MRISMFTKQHLIHSIRLTKLVTLLTLGYAICHHSSLESELLLLTGNKNVQTFEPVTLNFNSAVEKTMGESLNLNIAGDEVQMKEGLLEQSRLYPNPLFFYDLQTSQYGWQTRSEIYSLSQLIDLGGKQGENIKIASNEYCAALWGYEVAKMERLNKLTKAFVLTVAQQELFQIAVDQQKTADEFLKMTQLKFDQGKISLIEKHKTELTKSLADLVVRQKRAEFQNSQKKSGCNLLLFT